MTVGDTTKNGTGGNYNNNEKNHQVPSLPPSGFSFNRQIKPLLYFVIFLVCSGCLSLIIGEEKERQAWESAPSTIDYYTTDEVCYDSTSNKVLNCGHCGHCSNVHDIKIYHDTRLTLTSTMTYCAFEDMLYGGDAYECLQKETGMTPNCSQCWVMNYHCNRQHCMRTCLKHRKLPWLPSWKTWNSGPLDPCIACDEKFCGPDFLACAGANRRRAGVVSDIERDIEMEVCTKVDWDWILKSKSNNKDGDDDHEEKKNDGNDKRQEDIGGEL